MSKPNAYKVRQSHSKKGKDGSNDKVAFFFCCFIGFDNLNGRQGEEERNTNRLIDDIRIDEEGRK